MTFAQTQNIYCPYFTFYFIYIVCIYFLLSAFKISVVAILKGILCIYRSIILIQATHGITLATKATEWTADYGQV